MKKQVINDSHIHLFANGFPGKYGALFPKDGDFRIYEGIRKAHHIDRALVVGYEGDPWAKGNNAYIAKLARKHKWIVPLAYCALDGSVPGTQFARWWKDGFYGISLYINKKSDVQRALTLPEETFAQLNAKRAIVSINIPLELIDGLKVFFYRAPNARILISHLGQPGAVTAKMNAASAKKLLAPLVQQTSIQNIGVKLSGLYACNEYPHTGITPVLDVLTNAFGPQRLYWGSDFAPALDTVSFPQTIDAVKNHFTRAPQFAAVFRENLVSAIKNVA